MAHAGIIKTVLSGDTVIIMGMDASKGPPPEKLLSLSGVSAPRLGTKTTPDAPFAWDAREFVRRLAVGKRITFEVEAQAENRAFGTVYFEDGSSLASHLVANGWAKPRPGGPPELADAAAAADAQGLGMYSLAPGAAAASIRAVKYSGTFDPNALLAQCKGAPQDAIIEQVVTGSLLRVLLTEGFFQVTLMLSGIQCGSIRRGEDGTEEAAPFAREARYFVETRLLCRDVRVQLEGVDKNGSLLGTVLHPQGNISIELAKVGLARVVDWSSQGCAHAPQLRAAERTAKDKKLRIWRDYVPPNHGGDMGEFNGKIIEVASGDTMVVLDSTTNVERRVSLSSLRCPKMGREPEPFAADAKEFARKLLIGKKVRVLPEYKRSFPPTEGGAGGGLPQERTFATILFNTEKNAALSLLAEGLGVVNRHGQAEERADPTRYEEMLAAEDDARLAKKGMHSGMAPSKQAVTDLSTGDARERAKRFLNALQRQGRCRAIVQFVPNGSRFKLLVPKENCIINFACVGLRCPQCARRDQVGQASEPYGDEALAFARSLCFQRDVDVEIETADKNGTFMGTLFLPDKRNYNVALLSAGLARLVQPAADRAAFGAEMGAAEREAQAANLKVWENWSAEEEEAAARARQEELRAEAEPTPDADKQVVELMLTEVTAGDHFYAHVASDAATVEALQTQLAVSCKGGPANPPLEPKIGTYCCAQFSQDNEWYRAKVVARGMTECTVFFLDYGNQDTVTRDRLKPLDPTLGPKELSPQALECKLAYLVAGDPSDGADGEDAAVALSSAAMGSRMLARVEERTIDGVLLVTLFDDAQTNVNESLVSQGLLRVSKQEAKRSSAPLLATLREKEEYAKTRRLGMWRFGDIEEDDDFEFGMRRVQQQQAQAAAAAGGAPKTNAWGAKK